MNNPQCPITRELAALARFAAKKRRAMALVKYDPEFARWQAMSDSTFLALVSLRRELERPYNDVPLEPPQILPGGVPAQNGNRNAPYA